MEVKTSIEEKRVKSTIIRRRTVQPPAAPIPSPQALAPDSLAPEETPLPVETVSSDPQVLSETSTAGLEKPVLPVEKEADDFATPARKATRKKTRDELDMEMIERVGGLKKAAVILTEAPEKLERVYRPDKGSKKRRLVAKRDFKKTEITVAKASKKVIRIENTIVVGELAHRMSVKGAEVVRKLMGLGMVTSMNQTIDFDTAVLVAHDFGYEVENVAFEEAAVLTETAVKNLKLRAPVVTIMGHVDHGKTSLLDAIRRTNVAGGEAGGITQHIGAYEVELPKGKITFLDTPGHEAFTAIRARGAKATDLVILVVAADDGVMPQTVEAIHHAKAAKVPILVAINKIDKPGADPARVERQLMEHGLVSEKLGGDTIFIPVSAKEKRGLEELLEMILLQSEVLELKADSEMKAKGVVIESKLDKGRGPVATLLVQQGTLRGGDAVVAGVAWGRVRAMADHRGQPMREALPSMPVEILGLSQVPQAGDSFDAVSSEEDARLVAEHRLERERKVKAVVRPNLETFFAEAQKGPSIPELKVIVKADVHGSAEALRDSLAKLSGEKVKVSVVHWGVGALTESDVMLGVTSHAILLGFNVRPDARGREVAEKEHVEIRTYSIIYEALDDIRKAMEGLLKPIRKEEYLGRVEVRQLFKIGKVGVIAGSAVVDGKVIRSAPVRVLRDGKVIYEGRLSSLKRFKDDAREVTMGLECGIGIENFNDIKVGDIVESYQVQEIAAKL
ncbi:MAG: translation initiation factor IF-2 [Deltaproteobacteria bacterium]|nr:translation initiation factor IF-2 [Deltaproteobacteria bacterium]